MRRDQYFKSAVYVGFGIGTLVLLFPWLIRRLGIEVFVFEPGLLRWTGVAGMVLGAAMYFSCAWDFNSSGQGTPAFWDPPQRLIVNPWFRSVRNPMYVGVMLMNLGQGFWYGSTAILLYALVVTMCFHVFVVVYEEPHLSRVFGERYREYCRRVPRWVPRLPFHRGANDHGTAS